MLERCHHGGHCQHSADGTVFVRHNQKPRHKLEATACCWCDKRAEIEGYAKSPPPTETSYAVRDHGPFTPGSKSAEAIAAQSDEALVAALLDKERAVAEMRAPTIEEDELARAGAEAAKAAVLARLATLRREKAEAAPQAEVIR